jgi:hypothetical protein
VVWCELGWWVRSNWNNITGIGNLNDIARQCAEDQSGQCPDDLCSFGCFASRSMMEIFSSLFLDGDAQPGGGMTVRMAKALTI